MNRKREPLAMGVLRCVLAVAGVFGFVLLFTAGLVALGVHR